MQTHDDDDDDDDDDDMINDYDNDQTIVKFTLEETTKAQRGNRGIALLSL